MKLDQARLLLAKFYQEFRRMPSYAELAKLCGFKSKNAVAKLVAKLVEGGAVEQDRQGKLLPAKLFGAVPVLGLVEAGFPTVAEEAELDTLSLDDYLIGNRDSTFILEVKGDSMIDAGIHEGDMVIVERRETAREGDIVIAEIDHGWTMKYYRLKNNRPYLEPANPKYRPIYPTESFRIAAVVRGVVRKY